MTLLPVRPIATINAVDESRLLDEVCRVLEGGGDRERKAAGIASAMRRAIEMSPEARASLGAALRAD
jgi:hypothetical protein